MKPVLFILLLVTYTASAASTAQRDLQGYEIVPVVAKGWSWSKTKWAPRLEWRAYKVDRVAGQIYLCTAEISDPNRTNMPDKSTFYGKCRKLEWKGMPDSESISESTIATSRSPQHGDDPMAGTFESFWMVNQESGAVHLCVRDFGCFSLDDE